MYKGPIAGLPGAKPDYIRENCVIIRDYLPLRLLLFLSNHFRDNLLF
jgi:hypothetical protein